MVKFEKLLELEKAIPEERARELLRYSDFLVDYTNEEENARYRILKFEGRCYFHKMENGTISNCFEIAESWRPFPNVIIWEYTPDNFHRVKIDNRNIVKHNVSSLGREPNENDFFVYNGNKISYMDKETISVNGKKIRVIFDSSFTCNFNNKSFIRAQFGAAGLYKFVSQIAFSKSDKLYCYPLFDRYLEKMIEIYS